MRSRICGPAEWWNDCDIQPYVGRIEKTSGMAAPDLCDLVKWFVQPAE